MRCSAGVCGAILFGLLALSGQAPVSGATPAPDATPSPSPQQIFYSTFKRLFSYPVPAYIVEVSTWYTSGGSLSWRYAVRASDAMENYSAYRPDVHRLPALGPEKKAPPPMLQPPPGSVQTLPDPVTWIKPGFVGPLAWLVRPPPASPQATPLPDAPDVPDLKTIASVTVHRPDYAIALVGIETMQGHRVFHLSLRPYGDPVRHNLRDLWSDVDTYDLWAARYLAKCGFCSAPRPTTVVFMPVAGTWIVLLARFENPCGTPPCRYEILTNKIAFPKSLPDWLFDQAAYRTHQQAHEPDYLAPIIDPPSPNPSPSP